MIASGNFRIGKSIVSNHEVWSVRVRGRCDEQTGWSGELTKIPYRQRPPDQVDIVKRLIQNKRIPLRICHIREPVAEAEHRAGLAVNLRGKRHLGRLPQALQHLGKRSRGRRERLPDLGTGVTAAINGSAFTHPLLVLNSNQ